MEVDRDTFAAVVRAVEESVVHASAKKTTASAPAPDVSAEVEVKYAGDLRREMFVGLLRYYHTLTPDGLLETTTYEVSVNDVNEDATYRVEFSAETPDVRSARVMRKRRVAAPADIREYDLRVNVKEERVVREEGIRESVAAMLRAPSVAKTVRRKLRFSDLGATADFRHDFTHVRQAGDVRGDVSTLADACAVVANKGLDHYEAEIEVASSVTDARSTAARLLSKASVMLKVAQGVERLLPNARKRAVLNAYAALLGVAQQEHVLPPFVGPKPVTLKKDNVLFPPAPDATPVYRGYTVTEKADGERRLLFCARDDGRVYMLDDRLGVSDTGLAVPQAAGSLLDGEFLPAHKPARPASGFWCFDAYFYKGADLRDLPLLRRERLPAEGEGEGEKQPPAKNAAVSDRLAACEAFVAVAASCDTAAASSRNSNSRSSRTAGGASEDAFLGGGGGKRAAAATTAQARSRKTTKKGDASSSSGGPESGAAPPTAAAAPAPSATAATRVCVKRFYPVDTLAEMFAQTSQIFRRRDAGLFPYAVDGLIFTPAAAPVGDVGRAFAGGAWGAVMKWKPPENNTIDFLVRFRDADMVTHRANVYRVADLYVGARGAAHKRAAPQAAAAAPTEAVNPLDALSAFAEKMEGGGARHRRRAEQQQGERSEHTPSYGPALFRPEGDARTVHVAYLRVDEDGRVRVAEGGDDEVLDNTIVEFAYNAELPDDPAFRWIPLRVRHDKTQRYARTGAITRTANDARVAQEVWRSIHDPVTEQMLRGEQPEELRRGRDVHQQSKYYLRTDVARDERAAQPMYDFHNAWVKERMLLGAFAEDTEALFDIGSGKGGDLPKWLRMPRLRRVFGVDLVRDSLVDPVDGAYARLARIVHSLRKAGKRHEFPLAAFLPMDASKPLDARQVAALAHPEDRALADVLWARGDARRIVAARPSLAKFVGLAATPFDLVSCQFAMHYFFEHGASLKAFVDNVAASLRPGGFFIGTSLDGRLVDAALAAKERAKTTRGNADADETEIQGVAPDGRLMWHVRKLYGGALTDRPVKDRVGLRVQVYMESIGHAVDEFLVDYDLLTTAFATVGIHPLPAHIASDLFAGESESTDTFAPAFDDMTEYLSQHRSDDRRLLSAARMSEEHKRYSFLNRWYAFQKQTAR